MSSNVASLILNFDDSRTKFRFFTRIFCFWSILIDCHDFWIIFMVNYLFSSNIIVFIFHMSGQTRSNAISVKSCGFLNNDDKFVPIFLLVHFKMCTLLLKSHKKIKFISLFLFFSSRLVIISGKCSQVF